jgi:hypothetical protein
VALRLTSSPRIASDLPELPLELDRGGSGALSEAHKEIFAGLKAKWDAAPELNAAWSTAPLPVREHFLKMLRAVMISTAMPAMGAIRKNSSARPRGAMEHA